MFYKPEDELIKQLEIRFTELNIAGIVAASKQPGVAGALTFDPTWAVKERDESGAITKADLLEISVVPTMAYPGITWGVVSPRSTMDSAQPCEGCDDGSTPSGDTE